MTDVNIIADGNTAKLIALECERLGLTYRVTLSAFADSDIYICDIGLTPPETIASKKIITIGASRVDEFSLPSPFLLSDLRAMLIKLITHTPQKERNTVKPKSQKPFDIRLNSEKNSAEIGNSEISLSPTEFIILERLLDKKGEIVSHDEINQLIGGGESNKVNVYICFLRKKLESGGNKVIYSVRGKGFMIK